MSNQRKLDALLFELQSARSPLQQAKTLVRAWRTVRELGPADRRLLARHAGFDGAEQLLESLAVKRGGTAPALLLQALARVRNSDSAAVAEALADLRNPDRRLEAVAEGLDVASGLLVEPKFETNGGDRGQVGATDRNDDIGGALGELRAVHPKEDSGPPPPAVPPAPNAAVERSALEADAGGRGPTGGGPGGTEDEGQKKPDGTGTDGAPVGGAAEATAEQQPAERSRIAAETLPVPPGAAARDESVDWSRWRPVDEARRPAPAPPSEPPPPSREGPSPMFDAHAVLGALGAQQSVISQLKVLRRELSGFRGSSIDTLRQLVEAFPDGWARRRALSAMLESGLPPRAEDVLELAALLRSESDRRWCLGIFARSGRLWGPHLERALELLDSPASRRRVERAAKG